MDLDLREQFFNGTVLHYWAGAPYRVKSFRQEDSLAVVKLLIEKGADLLAVNSSGFTPLLDAANSFYRIDHPNMKVFDFLLERNEYNRAEKIEAIEVAGAVILASEGNVLLFPKAFSYWREALQLGHMEVKGSSIIEKARLNLKKVRTTEWNTLAELEDVIEHPDKFLIQSFLVLLRIFSSKNWDAISNLFWPVLMNSFTRKLRHQRRFSDICGFFWAMLETLHSRSDLSENRDVQWKTARVVETLIETFSRLDRDSPDFWTEEIIKTSLDLIVSSIVSSTEYRLPHDYIMCFLIQFVKNLSLLPQLLLNKDAMETLSEFRYYHGRNLLHKVVFSRIVHNNLFATVRLLLYAGCDPNAIDEDGNAPLHYLAHQDEGFWFRDLNMVVVLLLDFGAQLNIKNADGKTAVDLWKQKNGICGSGNEDNADLKLPDWCTELPTLASWSARVIRRKRIPYLELPITLISLIEKHKST